MRQVHDLERRQKHEAEAEERKRARKAEHEAAARERAARERAQEAAHEQQLQVIVFIGDTLVSWILVPLKQNTLSAVARTH